MRLILFFRPIAYEKCDWNDVVLMKVSTVTAQSNVQVSSIVSLDIHPTRIQNTQDFQYVCNQ